MAKISVNIITKNRSNVLTQALDSVLNQSYSDYEIIVVNDGSTDGTQAVLESYQDRLPLKIYSNGQSQGVRQARAQALAESSGEYIAILDDDDVWIDHDKLKKQAEYLDAHPEIGLLGTWAEMLDVSQDTISFWQPPTSDRAIREQMLIRSCFMNPTVMMRRGLVNQVGGYEASPEFSEDYSLWVRMAKLAKVENLPEKTTRFRIHNGGLTEKNNLYQIREAIRINWRYRASYPNFPKALVKWLAQYLMTLFFGVRFWAKFKTYFKI